jgi:hypothetical protein
MPKQENLLTAPSAPFSAVHPVLAALETATGNQYKLVAAFQQRHEWTKRLFDQVEPTNWTARIEAARADADVLAGLRQDYDEVALTFLSSWLSWDLGRSAMMEGRSAISKAIVAALKTNRELKTRRENDWLTPIFQARIILASEAHRQEVDDYIDMHSNTSFFQRLQQIQIEAFRTFNLGLKKLGARHYPTDDVSPQKLPKANNSYGKPRDLRHVNLVDFVDCVNSSHPASARLVDLARKAQEEMRALNAAEHELKVNQNGRINERQHAARLLDFLHTDGGAQAQYHCGGSLDQQVEAQTERRCEYEKYRHLLEVAKRNFKATIDALVATLKESAEETEAMLTQVETDQVTTVDRYLTLRIMINNCLSVDHSLRQWTRDLIQAERTLGTDLSRSAGKRALEAAFEKVERQYGYALIEPAQPDSNA